MIPPVAFSNLADQRLNTQAAQKYTVEVDGVSHNKADFRDCPMDLLEEAADFYNITNLALRKYEQDPWSDPVRHSTTLSRFLSLLYRIGELADGVEDLRDALPTEQTADREDIIGPVRRIGYEQYLSERKALNGAF